MRRATCGSSSTTRIMRAASVLESDSKRFAKVTENCAGEGAEGVGDRVEDRGERRREQRLPRRDRRGEQNAAADRHRVGSPPRTRRAVEQQKCKKPPRGEE